MEIKRISPDSKIALENQYDVEQQVEWCDCDCGVKHPKKNASGVDALWQLRGLHGGPKKKHLANPTKAAQNEGKDIAELLGKTYCYRTGTKKTIGWW